MWPDRVSNPGPAYGDKANIMIHKMQKFDFLKPNSFSNNYIIYSQII